MKPLRKSFVSGADDGNRTNTKGQKKGVTARFTVQSESNWSQMVEPARRESIPCRAGAPLSIIRLRLYFPRDMLVSCN